MMKRGLLAWICVAALGAEAARAQTPPLPTEPATTQAAPANVQVAAQQHWIGVAVENIPPMIGKLMKLEPGQGLLVLKVMPNSPAEKAKFQTGDLLITVNEKPLVSQQQLLAVANAGEEKGGVWQVKTARLGFIRDGERQNAEITPAKRPADMLVVGGTGNASTTQTGVDGATYMAPNGATLQVGPGYVVDLSVGSAGLSTSVRQVLSKGQSIVLSQESDGLGNVHNSVTVGGKTYDADPAGLEAMPAEVRELVKPLINQGVPQVRNGLRDRAQVTLEQQVKDQEQRINDLQRKLEKLQQQMGGGKEETGGSGGK